jgi:signal peptidase II
MRFLRRYGLFAVLLLFSLLLDQLTKVWVAGALQYRCDDGAAGAGAPEVAACRERGPRVRLAEPASRLSLAGDDGLRWTLRCDGDRPCLSGEVELGAAPSGARAEGEAPRLASGATYAVTAGDGQRSATRHFRFHSPAPSRVLIEGYLELHFAANPGAAWNFLADKPGWREPILIGIASLAALLLLFLAYRLQPGQRLYAGALALILAGALGNLIDRIRLSYVIDFIYFHVRDAFHWPHFNVADASIVAGAGLWLAYGLRTFLRARRERKAAPSPAP